MSIFQNRRLVCLLSASLIALGTGAAQATELGGDAVYPALPANATSAQGFVPKGWRIEAKAEGDLDRDGLADLALVLHEQNPAHIVEHKALGENPLDTNPRMLVVALRDKAGGYRLALANHTLISRRRIPTMEDHFDEIAIANGTLRVKMHMWLSAGSWGTSRSGYVFRHEQGRFKLIGFDSMSMQRNVGEIEERSYNFVTGKLKISTGSISSNAEKSRWQTLSKKPLIDIDAVGDGMAFSPEADGGR